jgi:hypothetical protein
MNEKQHILATIRQEFDRWEELLSRLTESQIIASHSGSRSIKDDIAHLWAWQQRSIARMEAGLNDREPYFPDWPLDLNPDSEEDIDQINQWIYETNRDLPWSDVYQAWREGFLRFLELGEAVPEKDLLEPGRYAWFYGYPLSYVLTASQEHHQEHYEYLQTKP